jgi:hypothetical protein
VSCETDALRFRCCAVNPNKVRPIGDSLSTFGLFARLNHFVNVSFAPSIDNAKQMRC